MKDSMRVGAKNPDTKGDVETGEVREANQGTFARTISSKMGGGGSHTLAAVDVSYTIQITDKESKEKKQKTLIHPVSFEIRPREMLAIMGASGAGKSTLLDILAQRVPFSQVDGKYVLDQRPIVPTEFKRMSGYVMQDDALYPLLTVRETLRFSAELRIPHLTRAEKYSLVEQTIAQLKLDRCADTKVGNELHRGVSGGERRRVSIGVDTVQQPSIIFLDEPTSGLDSTTALTIAETLSELCKRDRTVAMTIHQPSTRVLDVFDKVMFLSCGRMVYHGRPSNLPEYCNTLGKTPPPFSNIAEFFLEVVDEFEISDKVKDLADHHIQALRMREPSLAEGNGEQVELARTHNYANSVIAETSILLRRQWLNVIRTPELALARLMIATVVALMLGSLFWSANTDTEGLRERVSYFAYAIALFLFTSLEALPIFLQEQGVYTREHSRGAYRVISYSMTNFLIYVPVCAVMAVVFTCVSYFMIDLPPEGLGYQIMAIFFVLLGGNAFATCVSGFAPDPLTGNSAGTALLAFMFLFSGFFIPWDSIPPGWKWFSSLSMFKYPLEGMVLNMLHEEIERDRLTQEEADTFEVLVGVEDADKWTITYAMICFIFGFRLLFYIALITKHSGARK